MKKFRKLLSLAVISFLTSCSGSGDITGTYKFGMGKTTGTHFTAKVVLAATEYKTENPDIKAKNPKDMKLTLDMGTEQKGTDIEKILALLENGYYYTHKDSNKISMCFPDIVKALEELQTEGVKITDEQLTAIIEHIVYSYIDGNNLVLSIPVFGSDDITNAENDIIQQLTWYGIYISASCPNAPVTMFDFTQAPNAGKYNHEPGSKITTEAVEAMKKDFKCYFCNTGVEIQKDGIWTPVAGMYKVEIPVNEGEEVKYEYHVANYLDYSTSLANLDVKIVNSTLSIKSEKSAYLEMEYDTTAGDYKVTKVYQDSSKTKELSLTDDFTIKDYFNFRKAHTVELGLQKE